VTVQEREHGHAVTPTPPERRGWKRWTAGGWLRALWVMPLSFVLGLLLVLASRRALGYETAGFGTLNPAGDHFFQYGAVELQVLVVTWLVVGRDAALLALYVLLLFRLKTSTPSSEKTSRQSGLRRSRARSVAVANGSQRSA